MATFQIKVVLLGRPSVGKTTVLNALFKYDRYEVSKGPTTAGIFECVIKNGAQSVYTPNSTTSSKHLNAEFRENPAKLFSASGSLTIDEPRLKMRYDTELVIVDVPGLTTASSVYHTYVSDYWDTFDCAVLVMDVGECVSMETQSPLLSFVKKLQKKRATPLIVLCNKVDDPDDAEIKTRVCKAKQEVERVFAGQECNLSFIAISACKAFIYRAASVMPLGYFKHLDKELIDWIGKEERGRYKWQEMSEEEQYKAVRDVGQDKSKCDMRLKACNFDAFLQALENVLGAEKSQKEILAKQLKVAASKVSFSSEFGQQLCQIYEKSVLLGKAVEDIITQFWKLWEEAKADAVAKFQSDPAASKDFHRLFDQLVCWSKSPAICSKVAGAMKDLVRDKCAVIVNNAPHICSSDVAETSWSKLSPFQFTAIVDSICINSQRKVYCENFAFQYAALLAARQWASSSPSAAIRGDWNAIMGAIQEMVPESVSDPKHWGYLEWKVCQYLKTSEMHAAASEDNGEASVSVTASGA